MKSFSLHLKGLSSKARKEIVSEQSLNKDLIDSSVL